MTTINLAQQRIVVEAPAKRIVVVGAIPGETGPTGPQGPAGVGPPGSIVMYGGETAPAGFLLCDGSLISRELYPALFAVIGEAYGAGDGSTTFALPDLRSRFPVGKGLAAWSDSLGEAGGNADSVVVAHTHSLSVSGTTSSDSHSHTATTSSDSHSHTATTNSDSHSHSVDPPATNVGFGTGPNGGGAVKGFMVMLSTGVGSSDADRLYRGAPQSTTGWQMGWYNDATPEVNIASFTSGSDSHSHTLTTSSDSHSHTLTTSSDSHSHTVTSTGTSGSTGESGTNKNLPPYITLNFIIKT